MVLRDRYETTYGIYNHEIPDPNRPLALVAMHPKEDASRGSLLYERIKDFGRNEVYKHYGINLKDFLDLPTDVCMTILESTAELRNQTGKMAGDVLDKLEKEMGGK